MPHTDINELRTLMQQAMASYTSSCTMYERITLGFTVEAVLQLATIANALESLANIHDTLTTDLSNNLTDIKLHQP